MKPILVLIAQAHGSDTPGKYSPDKRLLEYRWSREICSKLSEALSHLQFDSIIINPEEKEISLSEQARRVNEIYDREIKNYNSIVLVSPHVNASVGSGWSAASGWMCFVYTKASKNSCTLARCLADRAYDKYHLEGNRYIPEDRFFRANFAILRQTKCPAILTENMFQTNKDDVDFLLSETGKNTIVNIHVCGIISYLQKMMIKK